MQDLFFRDRVSLFPVSQEIAPRLASVHLENNGPFRIRYPAGRYRLESGEPWFVDFISGAIDTAVQSWLNLECGPVPPCWRRTVFPSREFLDTIGPERAAFGPMPQDLARGLVEIFVNECRDLLAVLDYDAPGWIIQVEAKAVRPAFSLRPGVPRLRPDSIG